MAIFCRLSGFLPQISTKRVPCPKRIFLRKSWSLGFHALLQASIWVGVSSWIFVLFATFCDTKGVTLCDKIAKWMGISHFGIPQRTCFPRNGRTSARHRGPSLASVVEHRWIRLVSVGSYAFTSATFSTTSSSGVLPTELCRGIFPQIRSGAFPFVFVLGEGVNPFKSD